MLDFPQCEADDGQADDAGQDHEREGALVGRAILEVSPHAVRQQDQLERREQPARRYGRKVEPLAERPAGFGPVKVCLEPFDVVFLHDRFQHIADVRGVRPHASIVVEPHAAKIQQGDRSKYDQSRILDTQRSRAGRKREQDDRVALETSPLNLVRSCRELRHRESHAILPENRVPSLLICWWTAATGGLCFRHYFPPHLLGHFPLQATATIK